MEFHNIIRFIQLQILLPHPSGPAEDLESLVHVYCFCDRVIEGRYGMWDEFSMCYAKHSKRFLVLDRQRLGNAHKETDV